MKHSTSGLGLAALAGLALLGATFETGAAPLRADLPVTIDAPVVSIAGKALAPSRGGRQRADDDGLTCNSNLGSGECSDWLNTLCDLGYGGMSSEPGGGETCAPPPASADD